MQGGLPGIERNRFIIGQPGRGRQEIQAEFSPDVRPPQQLAQVAAEEEQDNERAERDQLQHDPARDHIGPECPLQVVLVVARVALEVAACVALGKRVYVFSGAYFGELKKQTDGI